MRAAAEIAAVIVGSQRFLRLLGIEGWAALVGALLGILTVVTLLSVPAIRAARREGEEPARHLESPAHAPNGRTLLEYDP
ncbi:hypothetical protein KIMH_02410 [Bombiscardovia apis]|uniref:Uncharacterized protein n=1 Tax=Bombiscardovia apis TaxID=2932182 RepID=A0ABN6SHS0_9BIFI|nr:hypothetical protein KIMH_02410 [Bombiscardovia apis]